MIAPCSFGDIVADINDHGYRIINLFQIAGGWHALVGPPYDKTDGHDRVFGRGDTAEHALEQAWAMAQKALPAKEPVAYTSYTGTPAEEIAAVVEESVDALDDVLG